MSITTRWFWILNLLFLGSISSMLWAQTPEMPARISELQEILQDENTPEQEWIEAVQELAALGSEDAKTAVVNVPVMASAALSTGT